MDNKKISKIFKEIADILEIEGQNVFRIRSYQRAAQLIESYPHNMKDLAEKGVDELTSIKGIGKDLAQKIIEIVETGKCEMHQKLLKDFNPDLLKMLDIRGVGPKKVKLFRNELGIETIDALKEAAEKGQIQELDGMGEKSEKEILNSIEDMSKMSGRMLIHDAMTTVEAYLGYMKSCEDVGALEYAGSLRRMQETVGDLDLLVTAKEGGQKRAPKDATKKEATAVGGGSEEAERIFDHFVEYEEVEKVIARGDTKSSVLLKSGVQVDLRVVDKGSFGAALHYFTGSKAHNIQIRGRAQKMGMKVNEYAVTKDDQPVAGKTEKEMFEKLGLAYIEPELRTGSGEIEAAEKGELPQLVKLTDIKGDLHLHSNWSDGSNTLEEVVEAYRAAGFEYIAVTDHSPSLKVANGLEIERLQEKNKEIDELQKQYDDFRILKGSEVDILKDGTMDYPDEILAGLDVVVASVHNNFKLSQAEQTERIIKAIQNPHVNIIGHLHGRLIGKRDGYEIDFDAILEAAIEYGVALEINSQPLRLDVYDYNCRLMKERGAKVVINTDSHHVSQNEFMRYGVGVARRGWLEKADVLNTLEVEELLECFT